MSVKVAFRESGAGGGGGRAVIIPRRAIRSEDGQDIVFVARNGRAERRAVKVGSVQDQDAVLTAGVAGSERVIVEGPADLADGIGIKEAP